VLALWIGAITPALAQEASLVHVDKVLSEPMSQTVPVIGRLVTRRSGQVATRIGGAVREFYVEVGDRVAEGEPIAQLDTDLLEAQLALVTGELRQAEADLAVSQAALQLAMQELERYAGLLETEAYSRARHDDAVQNLARAEAEIAKAQAQIATRNGALQLNRLNLEYAQILAPYDGVITQKMAEAGSYVRTGDPLVHMISDTSLEIEADVPAQRILALVEGAEVNFVLDDGSVHIAVVRAVLPVENPLTRTRPVRFTPVFSGQEGVLADAQSVVVHVPVGAARDVLTVHKDAIIQRQGESIVYVVVDGIAEQREVELGESTGGRIEVISGLDAGDEVVIRGNERLQPGAAVQVDAGS
jgi:RND family efflux transporter MFP subunit